MFIYNDIYDYFQSNNHYRYLKFMFNIYLKYMFYLSSISFSCLQRLTSVLELQVIILIHTYPDLCTFITQQCIYNNIYYFLYFSNFTKIICCAILKFFKSQPYFEIYVDAYRAHILVHISPCIYLGISQENTLKIEYLNLKLDLPSTLLDSAKLLSKSLYQFILPSASNA